MPGARSAQAGHTGAETAPAGGETPPVQPARTPALHWLRVVVGPSASPASRQSLHERYSLHKSEARCGGVPPPQRWRETVTRAPGQRAPPVRLPETTRTWQTGRRTGCDRLFRAMTTLELHASMVRRGKLLEYATIGYNVLEGVIAIAAGAAAGSIALIGFGIDSGIEVLASVLLVWRLHAGARAEKRALQLVGVSFLLLAAYVAFDAGKSLFLRETPEASPVGIVLAAASVVIMPLLVRAKRKVADAIQSRAMHAEATQTQLCAYLSAILLAGLALNAAFGLWWADPLAALAMVPIIANEGREALKGEECGCTH